MDNIGKPLIATGIAYGGSKYLLQNDGNVTAFGTSLDKNIAVAGAIGIADFIARNSSHLVIPHIPNMSAQYKNIAQKAVVPAITAAASYGIETVGTSQSYYSSSNGKGPIMNAALGAASTIGADYIGDAISKRY